MPRIPCPKILKAVLTLPGDKSISHRAVMLSAIAKGTTTICNFLDSDDTLATLNAFKRLGAAIAYDRKNATVIVRGKGKFLKPKTRTLAMQESGTTIRLIAGILSGLSAYGHHVGVGSSYSAFIAPLGHIAARLHSIGNQARQAIAPGPFRTMILVCAHAGVKTGEDGPTHADPQALQLLQENFPLGTFITLTPWDPQEIWTLLSAALARQPAVIAPFVTRPAETIIDRKALGLALATEAAQGLYLLRRAKGNRKGTLVLQGSEVANAFVGETLPLLEREGIDLDVFYVASTELFDLLPQSEQERIFPDERAREAMGITGFTLPTMDRWIRSERGRQLTLHPFRKGHYLGSGQADQVLAEAELDGKSQFQGILQYVRDGQ